MLKQKYHSCEICDKLLRKGLLTNRHVKCQKKIESRVKNGSCMLCDNKPIEPFDVNIFCNKHFKQIDNLKSYIYRPKTASLQNAIDYFISKGELKNNTAGFLMPSGVFYKIDDEHFDIVKDANYSISRNSEPTMEWFLKETGAVRICHQSMFKHIGFEYYNINSTQLNMIEKFFSYITPKDIVEIEPHGNKLANYLKRKISKEIGCCVNVN